MSQALQMSPKAAEKMSYIAGKLARLKKQQAEATQRTVTTLEVSVTGALLGFAEGRYDKKEMFGAPYGALLGVGAHIGAYVAGGAEADHLHAIGDGGFAVAAYQFGRDVGIERKAKANGQTTQTAGWYPRRVA